MSHKNIFAAWREEVVHLGNKIKSKTVVMILTITNILM